MKGIFSKIWYGFGSGEKKDVAPDEITNKVNKRRKRRKRKRLERRSRKQNRA